MTTGFGILGAGMISSLHASALKESKKARLAAVCDVSRERAEKLAKEFAPDAKVYTDLADMLRDEAVQVVNIVTPNHLHTDAVIACAAAKKHVLCEKPPAMSLADTDRMLAACQKAAVKFGIFVQCRIREPVRQLKKALDAGRFGRVLRADAVMKWYRSGQYYHSDAWRSQRQSGAGVTIQHAFHYIDLLQYLMGPAETVDARMCNVAHQDVHIEDTLDAFLKFKNGAVGSVTASTGLWPGSDMRIEVYGEKGAAIIQGAAFSLWQFQEENPEDAAIRASGNAAQATAGSSPTALASIDHQVVIDDCVDAIAENREVVIPCAAVRPTLEMALAMYLSDKIKSSVNLPLVDESQIWE